MWVRGTPDAARLLALPAGLILAGIGGIGVWAAFGLGQIVGVAVVSALVFAIFQFARAFRVIERCRRRADDWLRTSVTGRSLPPTRGGRRS